MKILGISCYYHDSAAALICDGRVVAAAEEERFTRRKHDSGFPANAIRFCLDHTATPGGALDLVVFYDKPLRRLERVLACARPFGARAEALVQRHLSDFVHLESRIPEDVASCLGCQAQVVFCEHHLSHAASAFYTSPYSEAAILTVDGVGEWATTGLFVGSRTGIEEFREIHYPQSLGLFYAGLTAYLGFEVNEGEYKVMGLAAYGRPTFESEFVELLTLCGDGSFRLNLDHFAFMYDGKCMFTPRLPELLGPARAAGEPLEERHMNIAASAQKRLEAALLNLARAARRETGLDRLCMAGGVAHNVVANSRILRESEFSDLFVQPAAGDSGGAVGAALYAHFARVPARWRPVADYDTCLGPRYDNEEIRAVLDRFGARYEEIEAADLFRLAAELLHENFVLGWFQGRMEFGPRALGCRSILANPCHAEIKEILNRRIKHREEFRPFAPAVLEEHAAEYFDHRGNSPHMLFCPNVRPEKRGVIPAATHVDGTARVQTVSKTGNPRFYQLIHEFYRLSGVPVVINTSFNGRGEPIVCTPADALRCFYAADIDFLVIGDFLVRRAF